MSSPIHINRSRGYYIGQVRGVGCRRWLTASGRCKSAQAALSKAILAMSKNDKRARALFVDNSGWYEPHVAMEASR